MDNGCRSRPPLRRLLIGGTLLALLLLVLAALLSLMLLYWLPAYQDNSRSVTEHWQRVGAPVRLLVDTDAGVDDAFALLLALNSPGVTLEAVSCVHGNAAVRDVAANVLKVLRAARRLQVAVFAGAERALGPPPPPPPPEPYFGADGFGDVQLAGDAAPDPRRYLQAEHAADALVRLAAQHPGHLSLLCLGPLTNIALAAQKDPNFLSNLKEIVVLGGSVEGIGNTKPGVEFNFYMDPEAASFIFDSNITSNNEIKPIKLVPWETIFSRNRIAMAWRRDVLGAVGSDMMQLLNRAEHLQLSAAGSAPWLCGDAVAAAVLLYPQMVLSESRHRLAVEVCGRHARGAAFVDYGADAARGNVVIVRDLDVHLYKAALLAGARH